MIYFCTNPGPTSVVLYVPSFSNGRGIAFYVGHPFMLIVAGVIAWINIHSHYHPELDEEGEIDYQVPSPTPPGYCPGCGHLIDDHPLWLCNYA